MKAAGLVEPGTDLDNPNFAAMADAMGILGIRAEADETENYVYAIPLQN